MTLQTAAVLVIAIAAALAVRSALVELVAIRRLLEQRETPASGAVPGTGDPAKRLEELAKRFERFDQELAVFYMPTAFTLEELGHPAPVCSMRVGQAPGIGAKG